MPLAYRRPTGGEGEEMKYTVLCTLEIEAESESEATERVYDVEPDAEDFGIRIVKVEVLPAEH